MVIEDKFRYVNIFPENCHCGIIILKMCLLCEFMPELIPFIRALVFKEKPRFVYRLYDKFDVQEDLNNHFYS